MSDNPDTYTITTAAASGDGTGRNPYARILDLERQFAEARAEADALLAGLSAIIHCQSHLSRADMREAAADILDEAGLKPKWLDGDQSPFVQRALAAEAKCDRLASELATMTASRDGYVKDSNARAAECDRLAADNARLRDMAFRAADQCDLWIKQTYSGGWSTHQVESQRELAKSLRLSAGKE